MIPTRTLQVLALLLINVSVAVGAEATQPQERPLDRSPSAASAGAQERPKIGLVLSGGGARGAAHVGVLKIIDELKIPIDAVAGTSMGAVVGGLYASGMPAKDIEKLLNSVNWQDAFQDRPPRAELGYRRKQDDRNFLVRYALGIRDEGFVLPRGLVQGQKFEQVLRNAALPVAHIQDFDRLPIPFRAIATDLETGELVSMSSGDLVTALRASMSAPGVFTPAPRDGRLLIDGGIVENLPIDTARKMGVDRLIVVDVSFPLYAREELASPLEVTNQAFAILIRGRTLEQRAKLTADDVIIDPPLGRYASADFSRVREALRAGETAASGMRSQLAKLSLSDEDYIRYLAARQVSTTTLPTIRFVRPAADSEQYAALIAATMSDIVDAPLDKDTIRDRLSSLYALDLFETIDYRLIEEEGREGLEVSLRRKSWGPNYVRFGLNLEDDFEGNSRYNAAARFIMTELNGLGAEWLTDIQIGENPKLFTEFYQPMSLARRFFFAPRFEFEERSVFRLQEQDRVAEYRVRTIDTALDVGRELANWGEVRVGVRRGTGRSHVLIGQDTSVVPLEPGEAVPLKHFDRGGFYTRFAYDKLDSIFFPRRGQQFEFEWRAERENFGADQEFDTLSASWLIARSLDRHTLIFWTDFGTTIDDLPTAENFFSLGGFFNLSGLPPGYLAGPHYGIGRFIYYRKIGRGGSGVLDLPAYAGISLEAGNTWFAKSEASFGSLRKDASIFFGVDSPLGPVYLAAGFDEGGNSAFYLFLGRTF